MDMAHARSGMPRRKRATPAKRRTTTSPKRRNRQGAKPPTPWPMRQGRKKVHAFSGSRKHKFHTARTRPHTTRFLLSSLSLSLLALPRAQRGATLAWAKQRGASTPMTLYRHWPTPFTTGETGASTPPARSPSGACGGRGRRISSRINEPCAHRAPHRRPSRLPG